ncbi:unnamed protein product, partial [Polarella glacialis]
DQAPGQGFVGGVMPQAAIFKQADLVSVWSNSAQKWCDGEVVNVADSDTLPPSSLPKYYKSYGRCRGEDTSRVARSVFRNGEKVDSAGRHSEGAAKEVIRGPASTNHLQTSKMQQTVVVYCCSSHCFSFFLFPSCLLLVG